MQGVVIYGAGGHARELAFQLDFDGIPVLAFVDDHAEGRRSINEVPVLTRPDAMAQFPKAQWHVGIGSPMTRARIIADLSGKVALGDYFSSRAIVAPTAKVASPAQVFANSIISDGCALGPGVIVNFGCIVSHDVTIGANTTVCPRAVIAGNVRIGANVWVGIGATFKNGTPENPLTVGDGAIIGAGACVVGEVAAHATVKGVPAR